MMHHRSKSVLRVVGIVLGPRGRRRGREVDRRRRDSRGAVAGRRQHRVDVRRLRGRDRGRSGSVAPAAARPGAPVVGRDARQPLRRLRHQRAGAVLRPRRSGAPACGCRAASDRPASRRWSSTACCSSRRGRRSCSSRRWQRRASPPSRAATCWPRLISAASSDRRRGRRGGCRARPPGRQAALGADRVRRPADPPAPARQWQRRGPSPPSAVDPSTAACTAC